MTNQIYEKIRSEFEQKRREAQKAARMRKNEIYAAVPALAEIDRSINLTASEYSIRIINGENVENEMEGKLKQLSDKKDRCLSQHGLSRKDFMPVYSCPLCEDTGILNGEFCKCFKSRIIQENFKSSNIGNNLDYQSFEKFDFRFYPDDKYGSYPLTPYENMKRNYGICKKFADNFEKAKKSLLLIGGTGLGKTYLSTCIAKQLLTDGKSVIYISAVDFFKRIEKSRFEQNDGEMKMFESCDLLIIDDLGTEAPSAYTIAVFSDILDKRWRCERKLIISSNNRLSEFEKIYGQRVFSRLAGSFECLLFYGKDIRVQKFMNGED